MPKPPGTYRHRRMVDKVRIQADRSKRTVTVARQNDFLEFSKAVDKVAEDELQSWHRFMNDLRKRLESGEPMSASDQNRRKVAEIIGEVRSMFESVQDLQKIESTLAAPVRPVIRAPANPPIDLSIVIALCLLLEVLVRVVGRKRVKSKSE